jgi:hypothetical protein
MVYASREEKESVYCLKATKTPPPIVVAVTFGNRLLCHVLAVGAFIPAHYVPGTTFVPHYEPLHSIMPTFLHPPQHPAASVVSLLSIPQAPFIQSVTTQAIFPPISNGCLRSCGE